ncbi:MAG: GNAT family N-acetyltransferase, partial [Bosea sp. (in: a-proteobacteria)]
YPEFEGCGYAREAAEAMLSWARDIRELPSLVSYVDPENTRSAVLALRLGAILDPSAERPAPEDLVYRHYPRASD